MSFRELAKQHPFSFDPHISSFHALSAGQRAVTLKPETPKTVYKERLRGAKVCLDIMQNCLSGGYINFGVFALYNDRSLTSALQVIFKIITLIPLSELMVCALNY